jgi:hypothetical protein
MEDLAMPAWLRISGLLAILTAVLALAACSINVRKDNEGRDKNVDINTPFGGIHVNENADARDTGLPVYPGARVKEKSREGDQKSANVDISTSAFGLKVVAVEYQSNDAPDKIIAYYQGQLKKYGNVLQCHTSHSATYTTHGHHNEDSEELKCEGDNSGKTIELKAGTKSNQHIVSIEPKDKGSDFALVYVRTRGKEGTI